MPRAPIEHLRATHRPLVYGHRGASARAPENTMAAFALALAEGADGVELDVHVCGSGELIVFHDADLARIAGADGRVSQLGYPHLRALDVGQGERIPLLDDVLDLVVGQGRLVNIEVKPDGPDHGLLVRSMANLLQRRPRSEQLQIFLSTFHPGLLARLREACPAAIPLALLFDIPHTGRDRAQQLLATLDPEGAHPQQFLAQPAHVQQWRREGRFVNAWTLNEAEAIRAAAQAGVDGIITDCVREALEALQAPSDAT